MLELQTKFNELIKNRFNDEEVVKINKSVDFACIKHAGQKRDSGEETLTHLLHVGYKLAEVGADITSVICGVLHECLEHAETTSKEVYDNFGSEVSNILIGITKMPVIKQARIQNSEEIEKLRELLLVLSKDARVAFIMLADRLHNMETLEYKSKDKQLKIAKETSDLFIPLAERLGMSGFKRALEDLCFKYIYPKEYVEVHNYLDENFKKSEKKMNAIALTLENLAKQNNVDMRVQSRVKSAFGVFVKVRKNGYGAIYDVIANRILTKTVQDCYIMLGAVHNLWKPISSKIKDYIAAPKPNMYMSLHTTVLYPTDAGEVPVEIQIRTEQMHHYCEFGMAAHWIYKEGGKGSQITGASRDTMLKQMINDDIVVEAPVVEKSTYIDILSSGFNNDKIFVLTPNLNVMELPEGSITLDFAYAIHSNLGNKCVGAKINGKMVPINTRLATGDIVDIVTSQNSRGPSRDWIKIVKSNGSKNKIRAFFKKERREENIKIGKDICSAWAKRQGTSLAKILEHTDIIKEIFARNHFSIIDDLYAAVGYGGITSTQALSRVMQKIKEEERREKKQNKITKPKNNSNIVVDGQSDLFSRLAHCCMPIPGDEIVGYVSRGKGITVHRKDCPTIASIDQQRCIDINWDGNKGANSYVASIKIYCRNSAGLLALVSGKIADMGIDITYVSTETDKQGDKLLNIGIQIKDRSQLVDLINKLKALPDVYDVYR